MIYNNTNYYMQDTYNHKKRIMDNRRVESCAESYSILRLHGGMVWGLHRVAPSPGAMVLAR